MHSNLDSKFKDFVFGLTTPFRALSHCVRRPKLFALSVLPLTLTLIAVGFAFYGILNGAWHVIHDFVFSWAGNYSMIASQFALFILGTVLLYFAFQVMGLFIALLSSPFNDLLAEATEKTLGAPAIEVHFLDLLRVFFLDLRKTVIALLGLLFFSLFSLIPGLGALSFLGFALIETFTFVTYPQSRRGHGIYQSLVWMKNNWAVSFGFGFATLILFGIPVVNLFALPISVIGGTMIFLRR